ncbi:MAG: division/cell wall cluster transcriptional repressor MraZ [Gammaproteobacteria bacterium]
MFRGLNEVSLDSKGRVAIPSRFRDRLTSIAAGCLVQTMSPLDCSLWIYPLPEWGLIEAKLAALSDFDRQSRRAKQMMRGYATDCQLDLQGRILIPASLREYAQLGKQIVILGQGNKFEIWDKQVWKEQRNIWLDSLADETSEPSETLKSLSL